LAPSWRIRSAAWVCLRHAERRLDGERPWPCQASLLSYLPPFSLLVFSLHCQPLRRQN
jgi:hypothetical protein